jgi:hypothetical protein
MMIGYVETYRELNDTKGATDSDASEGPPRSGGLALEAIFNRMDRNGDGKVSREELPDAQRQRFMRLDTNEDGSISLEEAERLKSFRDRMNPKE